MRKITAKYALILGKGISGTGAAKALSSSGVPYVICDENDLDDRFSAEFDLIVVSPSVWKNHRIFTLAAKTGAEVISELELGYRLCDKPVVAVTGTNGKTTTVKLLGEMFSHEYNVCVTGNVGRSFSADACENYDLYIAEVSSFQLENVRDFAPHIAVITNIASDHLDRHGTLMRYAAEKKKIAAAQTSKDFLVLSCDGIPTGALEAFFPSGQVVYTCIRGIVKGAYLLGEKIYWYDEFICRRSDIKMRGIHNVANSLSAIAAAKLYGIKNENIVAALGRFEPDEHRLQYVCSVRGVAFYDDSKGTNVAATKQAMFAMPSTFCLIAGGSDKGYEYDELFENIPSTLIEVCAIGDTADKIINAAKRRNFENVLLCNTLAEAVTEAYHSGADCVLLSPASASFDMFENYARRGEAFVSIVKDIAKSEKGR